MLLLFCCFSYGVSCFPAVFHCFAAVHRAACRKRSFYDPEARTLRGQLRSAYESLLFLDAAFAAANDVELALWKGVFYRPIEEFRTRLKQADKVRG